jgi:hypothetical protein
MDLLSQHTQNTSVSPNSSGWRVRIQRNSSKWCSFISFITSDMWRHKHYWNSALTVHFAQGPTVPKWSTVLKLITRKTGNAFTEFTKPQSVWKLLFRFTVLWSTIINVLSCLELEWLDIIIIISWQDQPIYRGERAVTGKRFKKKDTVWKLLILIMNIYRTVNN